MTQTSQHLVNQLVTPLTNIETAANSDLEELKNWLIAEKVVTQKAVNGRLSNFIPITCVPQGSSLGSPSLCTLTTCQIVSKIVRLECLLMTPDSIRYSVDF